MSKQIAILLCCTACLCADIGAAHHAPFIYDIEDERIMTGTVEAFEWVQPHTWVSLKTLDPDGKVTRWKLEGMSPLYLGQRGWNRYSLEQGDEIQVAYFPRRDGTLEGMFIRATLSDGSLKVMAITSPRRDTDR